MNPIAGRRNAELVALLRADFVPQQWTAYPIFNVSGPDFGAKGDGVVDDAAAINRALTAAGSVPGSMVYLPPTAAGIYRIGAPLYVPNGVTLRGGIGTSIRMQSSFSGFGVIVAKDWLDNVTANQGGYALEYVRIIGNPTGVSGNYHGIVTLGQDTSIFQCMVSETKGDGILITNKTQNGSRITPGVSFNRQQVLSCRVHTCTGTGIRFDGPTDCYVLFNHVNECDEDLIGTSADADDGTIGAGGMIIVGNHISEAGQDAIRIGSAGTGTIIANNNIENFGTTTTAGTYGGIVLPWAGQYGIIVADNTIWTAEIGNNLSTWRMIDIESGGDGNVQVVVTGNFARGDEKGTPICVRLGTGATSINVQVSNNQMHRVIDPDFQTDFVRGNENSWDYANAAPTGGTWRRGMRVWDESPTVGAPYAWICSASGSPGTWTALANL